MYIADEFAPHAFTEHLTNSLKLLEPQMSASASLGGQHDGGVRLLLRKIHLLL